MHRYYCTYFDRYYFVKGLALWRSLEACSSSPHTLWILCLDDFTYQALNSFRLNNLCLIRLSDFESWDPELAQAKNNRSRVEYYWTCTPSLPLFILEKNPEVDIITYLDADLCFFSDPEPIFAELADQSILILDHRYPLELKDHHLAELHGIYNVSWLSFRNDLSGQQALNWWRSKCIEWCYMLPQDGRFGDQKYLDDWPTRFQGTVVLQHKGAGLSPWNLPNYTLHQDRNQILVDDVPLIFYHFNRFSQILTHIFSIGTNEYSWSFAENYLQPVHVLAIYIPYSRLLAQLAEEHHLQDLNREKKFRGYGLLFLGFINGEIFLNASGSLNKCLIYLGLRGARAAWKSRQGYRSFRKKKYLRAFGHFLSALVLNPLFFTNEMFVKARNTQNITPAS